MRKDMPRICDELIATVIVWVSALALPRLLKKAVVMHMRFGMTDVRTEVFAIGYNFTSHLCDILAASFV
jgi:hypothetical protein